MQAGHDPACIFYAHRFEQVTHRFGVNERPFKQSDSFFPSDPIELPAQNPGTNF